MIAAKKLEAALDAASEVLVDIGKLIERDYERLMVHHRRTLVYAQFHATLLHGTLEVLWMHAGGIPCWLKDAPSIGTGRELLRKAQDHCAFLLEQLREADRLYVQLKRYPDPVPQVKRSADKTRLLPGEAVSWVLLRDLAADIPALLDAADRSLAAAEIAAI